MHLGNWHHKQKRERKLFLLVVESGTALCHEISEDPLGITQQINGQETMRV